MPILHGDLTSRGWANDSQFAESLAVGQVAPGPNGLWVVSLGYLLAGFWGAMAATLGVVLPPILVLGIDRIYRKVMDRPFVDGFVQGLTLAVTAIFVFVMAQLLRSNGIDAMSVSIVVGGFGLALTKRVPVSAIVFIGAFLGVLNVGR